MSAALRTSASLLVVKRVLVSATRCASTTTTTVANNGKTKTERPRRSLFSVPGSVPKMLTKAQTLGADAVVLDLEDGVPLDKKEMARTLVHQTLLDPNANFGRSEVCTRINGLDSSDGGDLALRDLESLLPCEKLQAVIIPKVETASDVRFVSRMIDALTSKDRDVRILAAVESALGVMNLREIAECALDADNKLDGLIFASEDYCADLEAIRTTKATELLFPRSQLVVAAKAFGLQAIDMVHINFRDIDGLKIECQEGKELGFTGKQAIHPGQIEPIHEAFSPSQKDVDFASKVVKEFDGRPVEIDGIVVDTPVYKWAVKLMRRAESAGLLK